MEAESIASLHQFWSQNNISVTLALIFEPSSIPSSQPILKRNKFIHLHADNPLWAIDTVNTTFSSL